MPSGLAIRARLPTCTCAASVGLHDSAVLREPRPEDEEVKRAEREPHLVGALKPGAHSLEVVRVPSPNLPGLASRVVGSFR
jgi:hypothetical protein